MDIFQLNFLNGSVRGLARRPVSLTLLMTMTRVKATLLRGLLMKRRRKKRKRKKMNKTFLDLIQ